MAVPAAGQTDLLELCRPLGVVQSIYLSKDKLTFASKGFAFVRYRRHADAKAALARLNGQGYDNLILRAEWASRYEHDNLIHNQWPDHREDSQWPDHRDMHNLEDQVLETLEGPSEARTQEKAHQIRARRHRPAKHYRV